MPKLSQYLPPPVSSEMSCLPSYLDLSAPSSPFPSSLTDSSFSFRPPLCIPALVYKTHWQQNMYRLCLLSSTSASPFLWTIGSVFPITQPLPFYSSSQLIPHSCSSSLWGSKWRQRSYLLSSSSLAKLALVASLGSCGRLSSPSLWRVSERSSCSFVAAPSLQPEACLPSESKREALIINSAKVIAATTAIYKLQLSRLLFFRLRKFWAFIEITCIVPSVYFHFHACKTHSWTAFVLV